MKKTGTAVVLFLFSGPSIAHALVQDPYQWDPLLGSATTDQVYTPVTPCRFVDGINAADRVSSAANSTTSRYYRVRGSVSSDFVSQGAAATAPNGCGVPTTATAIMVNLTVADPDADGDLKVDPADVLMPSSTSALNYTFGGARGKNLANGIVVKLCDLTIGACASDTDPTLPTRDILVTFHAGAAPVSTYFLADVLGYFAPAIAPTPPNFSGNLVGEVTGTQGATVVSNAVSANTGSAIVRRDGSGSFSAGSVTLSDNLILASSSTATLGNIMKGANRFIHNFGTDNTFIGVGAGNFTMTGSFNTASGRGALLKNTSGQSNTSSGASSLRDNTTGINNTAAGVNALFSNTTGFSNTANGWGALALNTTGGSNTASGVSALFSNTGSNNVAVGFNAGSNLTTGNSNIDIGNVGVAGEGNTIRIGTSGSQSKAFIAGIRGVTTGVADGIAVLIDSNGQLGTVSSSRRYKEDITDMGYASERLMTLRPVTFRYRKPYDDGEKPMHFGLIAEEVAETFPELVVLNQEGQPETVKYQDLTPMLLNEVQKQQRTISAQAARIADLESQATEIATLKQQVASMANLLKALTEPSVTQASLVNAPQEQP